MIVADGGEPEWLGGLPLLLLTLALDEADDVRRKTLVAIHIQSPKKNPGRGSAGFFKADMAGEAMSAPLDAVGQRAIEKSVPKINR